jgi:Tol biopolymer transport system component
VKLVVVPLSAALLLACSAGSPATPVPPPDAAAQAQTAVAQLNALNGAASQPNPPLPPPVPTLPPAAKGTTPGPAPASGAQTLATAKFDGRIVVARDDAIAVIENGQLRPVFKVEPGGSIKDPVFSPDGKTIAFAYAPPRPRVQPGRPVIDQLLFSDIMAVDADGSNAHPLAQHDAPGAILETPAWMPDGKAILYSYYAPTYKGDELVDEKLEVRRRAVSGGEATTLVKNASNPAVSRDGKWLAYVGEDQDQGQSLHVQPFGGGNDKLLVKPDRFAAILAPRFSPDGNTIAFSASDVSPSLTPSAPSSQPKASSPLDGLRALLEPSKAEAHGLPWEIWSVPTAGGAISQMTQIQEDTPYAAWAANGGRMLVYGAGGLYLVDVAAKKSAILSSDGSHGGMDWRSGS